MPIAIAIAMPIPSRAGPKKRNYERREKSERREREPGQVSTERIGKGVHGARRRSGMTTSTRQYLESHGFSIAIAIAIPIAITMPMPMPNIPTRPPPRAMDLDCYNLKPSFRVDIPFRFVHDAADLAGSRSVGGTRWAPRIREESRSSSSGYAGGTVSPITRSGSSMSSTAGSRRRADVSFQPTKRSNRGFTAMKGGYGRVGSTRGNPER
jgi:hypothetical protein